jgi:hypothetical protein
MWCCQPACRRCCKRRLAMGLSFDPLSFGQDSRAAPAIDVGGGEFVDAFVVSRVVVVVDESRDLRSSNGYDGPEILPSSTRHFYLIGADAGHISLHAVETTWCFWTTNTADSRATNVVVTIVDGPVVGYAQPL